MFLLCCRSWTTGYGAEGEIVALRPKENAPSTASQSAPEVGSAGGGAGFDAPTPQLLEDFAQMSQEECSRRAEAARWKAKAQQQKGGHDYRGVISSECVVGLPQLMRREMQVKSLMGASE